MRPSESHDSVSSLRAAGVSATGAPMTGQPWERTVPGPVHQPTTPRRDPWTEDVLVPGGHAALLAVPSGIVAFVVVVVVVQSGELLPRLGSAFAMAILTTCVIFASWAMLSIRKRQALWFTERALQRDLDGDGYQGQPPERRRAKLIEVEIEAPDRTSQICTLDSVLPEQVEVVAAKIITGMWDLSIRGFHADGLLSEPSARRLHAELLQKGYARKVSVAPNAAITLTSLGKAVLRALAISPVAPSVAGVVSVERGGNQTNNDDREGEV